MLFNLALTQATAIKAAHLKAANKSAIGVNPIEAVAIQDVLRTVAHEYVIGSMNFRGTLKNYENIYTIENNVNYRIITLPYLALNAAKANIQF